MLSWTLAETTPKPVRGRRGSGRTSAPKPETKEELDEKLGKDNVPF
jgi:hypothetical protein